MTTTLNSTNLTTTNNKNTVKLFNNSIIFILFQCLELVNTDIQQEQVKATDTKWFSEQRDFQSKQTK